MMSIRDYRTLKVVGMCARQDISQWCKMTGYLVHHMYSKTVYVIK